MKNRFSLALVVAVFFCALVSLHAQTNFEKRINCGSSTSALYQGETYDADNGVGYTFTAGDDLSTSGHGNFTLAAPFKPARYTKQTSMSYEFDVDNGDYRVILLFAEPYHGTGLAGTSDNTRLFNVDIDGTLPNITDLNVFVASGGANQIHAIDRTITVNDGKLTLTFSEGSGNDPMINAIEVLGQSSGSPDNQAPTVPSNVSAGYGSGTATIDWTASTDASGILRYDIQASQDGGAYSTIGTSATNQFITSSLAANSTYTFQVRAVDNSTNQNPSAYSNPSNSIDTGGTAPPTGTVWSESGSNSDIYYNSGNVGIGTTSPSSKLTVSNGSSVGAHHTFADITVSDDSGQGMVNILTPTNGIGYYCFSDSNDEYVGGMQYNHANDKLIFRSANHQTGDLVIDGNGNVGIGTTTPDAPLAVNGRIHAQEVLVDLSGWPDYVFEEAYELPTLEEVEKHINEKGHLINIPSAEEVGANGVQLGEMNKLLLEKIEELTLYIIELKKENELIKNELGLSSKTKKN